MSGVQDQAGGPVAYTLGETIGVGPHGRVALARGVIIAARHGPHRQRFLRGNGGQEAGIGLAFARDGLLGDRPAPVLDQISRHAIGGFFVLRRKTSAGSQQQPGQQTDQQPDKRGVRLSH